MLRGGKATVGREAEEENEKKREIKREWKGGKEKRGKEKEESVCTYIIIYTFVGLASKQLTLHLPVSQIPMCSRPHGIFYFQINT